MLENDSEYVPENKIFRGIFSLNYTGRCRWVSYLRQFYSIFPFTDFVIRYSFFFYAQIHQIEKINAQKKRQIILLDVSLTDVFLLVELTAYGNFWTKCRFYSRTRRVSIGWHLFLFANCCHWERYNLVIRGRRTCWGSIIIVKYIQSDSYVITVIIIVYAVYIYISFKNV